MRGKQAPSFKTEAALCAAFIAALPKGWVNYNETWGWDILLVHRESGAQIGVEAKLRLNAKVLCQAAEDRWCAREGPDFRAALVPEFGEHELAELAPHCGVTIIRYRHNDGGWRGAPFLPDLPSLADAEWWTREPWFPLLPSQRYRLPDYVPDVPAGTAAPVQLTHWKIQAMRLCALMEDSGHLTREDFKRLRMDIRRWRDAWLVPSEKGFVRGHYWPDFRKEHPNVFEEILADRTSWERPRSPVLDKVA